MDTITAIINLYKNVGFDDFFSLYKHLTTKFWKEDVDLVMYDVLGYECTKELTEKRCKQNKFRRDLINRYGACIITGYGDQVCEACHIKPFVLCNDKEKYDIDNGLLLNVLLHKLFDNFMISINPETLQIEIHNNLDKKMYDFVWEHKNKILKINKNSKKYLKFHYEIYKNNQSVNQPNK